MNKLKFFLIVSFIVSFSSGYSQEGSNGSQGTYKKRVLESTEVDLLTSFYYQDGDNAACTGGSGSESLIDGAGAMIISIPLNSDDVLKIDASVSAYSSASSSNINPFDGKKNADPFIASSGASRQDVWHSYKVSYTSHSDDRNDIWSAKTSVSAEFDYFSIGFGGHYTKLFNDKNTELSISPNVYFDTWKLLYPIELRNNGVSTGENSFNINSYTITGNPDYTNVFIPFESKRRNSYSVGLAFSQILSKKLQGSLLVDVVMQEGLLSTPFHRVYFSDFEDSFIEDFQLANDVERMPSTRLKIASGARLNYYINEMFVVRSFYRYYTDDWGINSHTASLEIPVKINDKYTIYPSYRFYNQTAADYFAPYNQHLSASEYHTSDYDLSQYSANQYSLGLIYKDIFTEKQIWKFGLKSLDFKYSFYSRDSGFYATILTVGAKFILDY